MTFRQFLLTLIWASCQCQEMSCLAVNDLACSTFGAATKEKGQLCYEASNPIVASQLLQHFMQSAEVQAQAGPGMSACRAGLPWCFGAPGSAAEARPALGVPRGKPQAQLVGSPRSGRRLCHTGMKGCLLSLWGLWAYFSSLGKLGLFPSLPILSQDVFLRYRRADILKEISFNLIKSVPGQNLQ